MTVSLGNLVELARHLQVATQRELGSYRVNVADVYAPALKSWADYGFQTVRVSDAQWAAEKSAASVSKQACDQIRFPWPTFMLVTPDFGGFTKALIGAGNAAAAAAPRRPSACVFLADFDPAPMKFGSLELFCEQLGECELPDQDRRRISCAARLAYAVAMEFDRAGTSEAPSRPTDGRSRRRMQNLGTSEYVVGRPVRHDVRRELRHWIETGDSRPLTTTWVCGHTKMQPHGIGGAERRKIWVDTYPRGEGPTLVREHII